MACTLSVISGGTATASQNYSLNLPSHGFDGVTTTCWGNNGAIPAWLRYQLPAAKTVCAYSVRFNFVTDGAWNNVSFAPKDWTLQGSNNGTDWTTLDTRTGLTFANPEVKTFNITSPASYLYYRINITKNGANQTSAGYVMVVDLGLFAEEAFLYAALHQPYSLLLETWLQQIYGDVRELSWSLHQPYSDAAVLQRSLLQPWADALHLEANLEQPFALPETLQAAIEQRWGIVAAVLGKSCEQIFHLEQNTTLFAGLCQPYAMLGEAARLHSLTTKLYVGGVRIPYVSLEWQATDSEFFWYCAFSVKSRAVADLCADGAAIRIEHMGEEYHLKCYGGWLLDKRHAEETYRVEGYSRTRDLDEATPLRQDFAGGLASQIVADLAAPFSIAVNWQMVDGWIGDGKLTANDETPLAVIRNIVADMGGIVQTTSAGDLLIVAEEEIAISDYPAASPAATINASLERISTSEQKDEQKGYNKFVVSDQAAAGGQFALDYVEIDATTRELRLFVVPLEGRQFTLTSSGGSEVTIEPVGVVDLPIIDELVEFVAGSGRTQRPVHGISAQAWQRDNLGAIAATEEGVLTAATPGYSLLKISYTSRYHKWLGRDSNIEKVQFIATEVLP